jgi:hypothetical protein
MKTVSQLASELRANTTAVRLSFSWLGTRKTLNPDQRARAASPFNADKNSLSATQKLFDTRHPAFARLTRLKTDIADHWRLSTLPYTEDGIRLLKKGQVADFTARMDEFRAEFDDAVANLETCLDELKDEAAKRLGDLYDAGNYPASVKEHFGFEWSFPSIEPPDYLAQLAPAVYQAEQQKIQARLQEAVNLAETAFLTEFKEMIDALHERLTPGPDGVKKVFRDSAVHNLGEFFQRFKAMHLGSSDDLEKLVADAEALVKGITPQELRDHDLLRQVIASDLGTLADKLTPLVVKQPRRKIIKPKVPEVHHASPQEVAAA